MDPEGAREAEELARERPAGWYVDPERPDGERYWDGEKWCERRGEGQEEHAHAPQGKANRLAVFALFCAFVIPVLGIVFGLVALDEIDESEGEERGRAMAQWAIGLGAVTLGFAIALGVWVAVRLG